MAVIAPEQTINKQKALEVVNQFLTHYQKCFSDKKTPNAKDFETNLSQNFHNISNGKPIGKNIQDFIKNISDVQKRYPTLKFTLPKEALVSGNKVVVQYSIDLADAQGEKAKTFVIAIATLDEKNLIKEWSQVSHRE